MEALSAAKHAAKHAGPPAWSVTLRWVRAAFSSTATTTAAPVPPRLLLLMPRRLGGGLDTRAAAHNNKMCIPRHVPSSRGGGPVGGFITRGACGGDCARGDTTLHGGAATRAFSKTQLGAISSTVRRVCTSAGGGGGGGSAREGQSIVAEEVSAHLLSLWAFIHRAALGVLWVGWVGWGCWMLCGLYLQFELVRISPEFERLRKLSQENVDIFQKSKATTRSFTVSLFLAPSLYRSLFPRMDSNISEQHEIHEQMKANCQEILAFFTPWTRAVYH